jgi:hypothetical protein
MTGRPGKFNRAGKNLPRKQKKVLEDAKGELRKDFGRDPK